MYVRPGVVAEPVPLRDRPVPVLRGSRPGQGRDRRRCRARPVHLRTGRPRTDHHGLRLLHRGGRARPVQLHGDHSTAAFLRHGSDADQIPGRLRPGSVHVISCHHALQFLELPRFIHDAARLLARDGALHVTTAVTEKIGRPVGLTEGQVTALQQSWSSSTRYDLYEQGQITALVLRGPCGRSPRTGLRMPPKGSAEAPPLLRPRPAAGPCSPRRPLRVARGGLHSPVRHRQSTTSGNGSGALLDPPTRPRPAADDPHRRPRPVRRAWRHPVGRLPDLPQPPTARPEYHELAATGVRGDYRGVHEPDVVLCLEVDRFGFRDGGAARGTAVVTPAGHGR